jgi:hypothetical protein
LELTPAPTAEIEAAWGAAANASLAKLAQYESKTAELGPEQWLVLVRCQDEKRLGATVPTLGRIWIKDFANSGSEGFVRIAKVPTSISIDLFLPGNHGSLTVAIVPRFKETRRWPDIIWHLLRSLG